MASTVLSMEGKGWSGMWVGKLKLMQIQSGCAGAGTELGNYPYYLSIFLYIYEILPDSIEVMAVLPPLLLLS